MKKTIHILLILFLLNSCSNEPKKEASKETKVVTKDVSKIDYPLDSLLSFDSEAALKKVYGKHVKRSVGYYPEGMGEYKNTLLFPDSKNQVEFVWEDDSLHYNKLQYIRLSGKNTDWKTKEGITIGTQMKALEFYNKQPFAFFGLEWDYSGAINWKDGYLNERNIFGSLAYPKDEIPEEFLDLLGDHTIESSSEIAKKAKLILSEIIMKPSN
ncbi:hypothetical protein H2O64_16435 [Kordia sp. YSTF-M3]|uniref:Lipoprotein n=1 Tax=Kordia aestuariivivens TaxID=2759037 RepID=A0ABR7QCY0_9FLAO|nr:hypothetical protein [Kordia aestuariivivens]MBC8756263.1 hypothetical protein [Kordia aestuariivivens]